MKLSVVFLALTILAGSQAFTDLQLPELSEKGQLAQESEIGQVLFAWASDRFARVNQRLDALRDAVPPEAQEVGNQIAQASWDVMKKVYDTLRTLNARVAPEREAFTQALMSDLNPILEKLDSYTLQLRHSVTQKGPELNERANELLKWLLEKAQPLAQEIQTSLQAAQDSLEPVVDRVQKEILTEVENTRNTFQQSAARALGVFNKHREAFDQFIRTPPFPEDH
ncbi:apolipoprotein A-IV-like [Tiliqua scincoides]|uniref:apolipoprotein A-IV-like n=1 Tax=Tiliqua scincoides TaxID=71010 RepID=UPI003462D32B